MPKNVATKGSARGCLFAKDRRREAFQEIVSKLAAKLSGWKKRALSQACLNVLIRSVACRPFLLNLFVMNWTHYKKGPVY